ncbi:dITP/XTP pyrophosphatase [wastewater metagenome]|uniref:dITP/XTP pyrophosphatase n=2 Tax=unclassified sequences TaxID=12908 RepID=A0A5B8R929_9ZZZZ|nr:MULTISPECIES: RdgB/HAM1 family non-canonical purine NTP pyrophosphatase [Arhodomonas]MCS4505299.1 RdgB/HAM1 family non-canonical purine NTP pyrophosphatase [Arhodomonas aquaeolei]QEA05041.1 dITP/XTP pyrophosphatase [uncultured organism]
MSDDTLLVLASNNPGKAREIEALLAPVGVRLVPQSFYYVPEAEETGLTFVENAIIKARNACAHTGRPAIADDSGLEVDGLDGAPGVRSARFAGEDADDAANNQRLLDELCDLPEAARRARFRCVVVCMRHAGDPTPLICEGSWEGRILETPRGEAGFGYDPLFFVPELGATAAELEASAKNRHSHRARALAALRERLGAYLGQ